MPHSSIYSKINRWKHCHACSTFISCSCSYSYLCLCINVEALFLGWFEWHTYPYIPNILALTINTKIQLVQAFPPGWKSEERYLGGCQLCGVKFIVDGTIKNHLIMALGGQIIPMQTDWPWLFEYIDNICCWAIFSLFLRRLNPAPAVLRKSRTSIYPNYKNYCN